MGRHYPRDWPEFEAWFPTEHAARSYVEAVRFRDGVCCYRCGRSDGVRRRPGPSWWCPSCRRSFTLTSGTLLERTRIDLRLWLRAAWLVSQSKSGVAAVTLERALGVHASTAWHLLHKLRSAMDQDQRSKLSGEVEIDEASVGGPEAGHPGRSRSRAQLVAIAVETYGDKGFGRARMARIYNESAVCLKDFIAENIEPGSLLLTDGLVAYKTAVAELAAEGLHYDHTAMAVSSLPGEAHEYLPGVHRLAALVKRWLLGTHQGAVERQHLDAYLDEFVFRFNRRSSKSRGLLFYRLVEALVATPPVSRQTIEGRLAQMRVDDAITEAIIKEEEERRKQERNARSRAKKAETTPF